MQRRILIGIALIIVSIFIFILYGRNHGQAALVAPTKLAATEVVGTTASNRAAVGDVPLAGRPGFHGEPPGAVLRMLVNLEESKMLVVGSPKIVQTPRPDGMPSHGVFVTSEQRTLFKSAELEIRETVSHEKLPVRTLEELSHPGAADERVVAREEMAPDHLVLNARNDEALTKLAQLGFHVIRSLGKDHSVVLKLPTGMRVEEALLAVRSVPGLKYAEPDWVVHITQTPNDSSFSQLWGMNNTGQTGGIPGADIHAPGAWDVSTGSDSVIVAVIDTGIDYTHPDLAPNMWINPGETGTDSGGLNKTSNGADDDGDGYVDDVYGYDFADEKATPRTIFSTAHTAPAPSAHAATTESV